MNVTCSTVDASKSAATVLVRILAIVKRASFWRRTAKSATVSRVVVIVCVIKLHFRHPLLHVHAVSLLNTLVASGGSLTRADLG